MSTNFVRILNPGSFLLHNNRRAQVFVKVEFMDGRLSISGVEGPTRGGDALGGRGQIGVKNISTPAEGWTVETIAKLGEIWDRWHLNDMRPGCEHQRADGWGSEDLEVITYKLNREGWDLRRKAETAAKVAAVAGKAADLTDEERATLAFDLGQRHYSAPDADGPLSGLMEVDKRERKRAGWTRPDEHPRGVLTKPCPVCGYKYGSAWLREEVPADVVEWLRGLPETTITPAWV